MQSGVKRSLRGRFMSEEEFRLMEERIRNGELVCFGGPTGESYAFADNPVKSHMTEAMLDDFARKAGINNG